MLYGNNCRRRYPTLSHQSSVHMSATVMCYGVICVLIPVNTVLYVQPMEFVNTLRNLQEQSVEDARSNNTCYSQVSSHVCYG